MLAFGLASKVILSLSSVKKINRRTGAGVTRAERGVKLIGKNVTFREPAPRFFSFKLSFPSTLNKLVLSQPELERRN